jgi:hypothetical protein
MTIDFARQLLVQRGYQDEADDGTGGGAAGDRGDNHGEVDDEAEAEAKAAKEAEAKAAAEKAEKEKNVQIPKARFDEAVGKERKAREEAEKRATEAEGKLAEKAANASSDAEKLQKEIDGLEDQLEAKMTEGTPAERKAIRQQIREKSAALIQAEVDKKAAYASAVAIEQVRYDNLVERSETDYPFLNPDVEATYNETLATEVVELKAAFEASGMGSTEALRRSLRTLAPALKAAKEAAAAGDEEAKKKAEEEAKAAAEDAGKKPEIKAAERREAAVAEGLKAKKGQPAAKTDAVGSQGKDAGKEPKVGELSDADYDKLPEEAKKKARGDTL